MITLNQNEADNCARESERKGMTHLAQFFSDICRFLGSDLALCTVSIELDKETARIAMDALGKE